MKSISTAAVLLLSLALANAQTSSTEDDTATSTSAATGQVQTVQVGQNGLVFEPPSITASAGDVVAFVIYSTHNVARSSFDNPCQPIGNSQDIWTGSDPAEGTVFSVTINDTNPVWLYCATQGHCEAGMAMVINPADDSDETLEAYQSAAADVTSTGSPTDIAGGVFGTPDDSETTTTDGEPTSSNPAETSSMDDAQTTSPPTGPTATSTTAAASPTTTPNAARNLFADMMMVGGAILAGSVMLM